MLYLCRVKPLRHYLRGFLIAAWAGDKIAEFSFPEISFHFPLRPWFFFVSPAYAGKSKSTFIGQSPAEDHPRVCGEKSKTKDTAAYTPGSPPHVRGKVIKNHMEVLMQRITPAYAGKRRCRENVRLLSKDHPRVCGEKTQEQWDMAVQKGSPPRMRGKVMHYKKHWLAA